MEADAKDFEEETQITSAHDRLPIRSTCFRSRVSWVRVPPAPLFFTSRAVAQLAEHRNTLWSQLRRSRFLHHNNRTTFDCRNGVHGERPIGLAGSNPAPSAEKHNGRTLACVCRRISDPNFVECSFISIRQNKPACSGAALRLLGRSLHVGKNTDPTAGAEYIHHHAREVGASQYHPNSQSPVRRLCTMLRRVFLM